MMKKNIIKQDVSIIVRAEILRFCCQKLTENIDNSDKADNEKLDKMIFSSWVGMIREVLEYASETEQEQIFKRDKDLKEFLVSFGVFKELIT